MKLEKLIKKLIIEQIHKDPTLDHLGKELSKMILKYPQTNERYQAIIFVLLSAFKYIRNDVDASWHSLVNVGEKIMRGDKFSLNSEVLDQLLDKSIKKSSEAEGELEYGPIVINKNIHELRVKNHVYIKIPSKLFNVLYFLMEHPHVVKSREEILDKIWKENYNVPDRNVDITITKLKKNYLKQYSNCIVSVPKRGYKFVPPRG